MVSSLNFALSLASQRDDRALGNERVRPFHPFSQVLGELAKSGAKHVLLLFRDHKCQYRGLYEWDQVRNDL